MSKLQNERKYYIKIRSVANPHFLISTTEEILRTLLDQKYLRQHQKIRKMDIEHTELLYIHVCVLCCSIYFYSARVARARKTTRCMMIFSVVFQIMLGILVWRGHQRGNRGIFVIPGHKQTQCCQIQISQPTTVGISLLVPNVISGVPTYVICISIEVSVENIFFVCT